MDLFDLLEHQEKSAPLAERMRPRTLDEFCGQGHLIGDNMLLRRAIKADKLGSCIFFGPPGCGKTTLANIISQTTKGKFVKLNAVSAGVADVKKVLEEAKNTLKMYGKRTYLLLDECHRFNKAQSDSLLQAVEDGTIIFIGSTTENPFASMTSAIVSRCRIFEFKRLTDEDILKMLNRAIVDKERGLGNYNLQVDSQALSHFVWASNGDLRCALNALELATITTNPDENGKIHITLTDAEQSLQKKSMSLGDDYYYDMLSAFCKSLRGSDSSAAVYYAQRLINAGIDPMIIARRTVAHASEDVGMADSNAMVVATSAMYAFEKMGKPEGLIPLFHAIIYVAEAEKSNSVIMAMELAGQDATKMADGEVKGYLKVRAYTDKEELKNRGEYKYPHNYGGYVKQQYLPDELKDKKYYNPTSNGDEVKVKERQKRREEQD